MLWSNFLHIYQPITQKPYWVKRISAESYRKLIDGFKKNKKAKLTLNINAVLPELLERDGCLDVVKGIKFLAQRGQIEFTGSVKYHPFMPLMPEDELVRQIKLNEITNKKYFGKYYQPRGFFTPEMAYSKKVGEIVRKAGYEWIILDELAYHHTGKMSENKIYKWESHPDFYFFFRNRDISFRILSAQVGISIFSAGMLTRLLGDRLKKQDYLITAMDGETFGHHRPGLENLLFDLYQVKDIESVKISELLLKFNQQELVEPRPSSWALLKKDLHTRQPFSRWADPDNQIHQCQWKLTNLALSEFKKLPLKNKKYPELRRLMDKATHSDQYWWASASPWWSLEMIEAGAKELLDIINGLPTTPSVVKARAKNFYHQIIDLGFQWQKSGRVEELAHQADEDVVHRITKELPYIPLAEYQSMVKNLERQMLHAAHDREYERAAQIKGRLLELVEKKDEITRKR